MSNGLRTFRIGQISPAPNLPNAICVTLNSYVDIKSSGSKRASLSISGFPDMQGGSERYAAIMLPDGRTAVSGTAADVFSGSVSKDINTVLVKGGTITFHVVGDGKDQNGDDINNYMKANTDYRFCIQMLNPADAMPCAAPKLTLQSDGGSRTYAMTVDTVTTLADYGAAGFACPGLVSEKRFLRATIRQSSNATGVESVFLVELLTNAEITGGESLTVTGLQGYATASSDRLGISYSKSGSYDADRTFGEEAAWNQQEGTLVFSVAQGKKVMPKNPLGATNPIGDYFELSFKLRNGPNPQDARPVRWCAWSF
jgi:hypothetical protein